MFLRIHLQSREVRRMNISEIGMEHRAMKWSIIIGQIMDFPPRILNAHILEHCFY